MRTEEYLKLVTDQLRCKKARSLVSEELQSHIEDQKNAFLEEGMDPGQAEEEAVREMGDPVAAGVALDRVHRPQMAWGLIALIGALNLAGLLAQYLIRIRMSPSGLPLESIWRSVVTTVLSFGVMVGVCYLDYSRVAARARLLALASCLLLLLFLPLFGLQVNGAKAWIAVGPLSVDIKLVLLLYIPLYGAILYSYRGGGRGAVLKGVLWILLPLLLAFRINSMITAALLFFTCGIMLALAVRQGWYQVPVRRTVAAVAAPLLASPALLAGAVWLFSGVDSYRWDRLRLMWEPVIFFGKLEETNDFHYLAFHLQRLLLNCRLVGEGAGAEQYGVGEVSDFMLTYLSAFCGILVAAALLLLLAFLFLRFLRLSLRQTNQLGRMMGAGCSLVLLFEVIFYTLGNLGMILFAGGYCPFLTYGGTGTLVTGVLLGLLLSIYRHQHILPEPKKRGKKQILLQL